MVLRTLPVFFCEEERYAELLLCSLVVASRAFGELRRTLSAVQHIEEIQKNKPTVRHEDNY